MQELVIISYNVHSVLSQARFDALLEEIKDIEWDIIVLVETWREEVRENFLLDAGHYWYASGGTRGRCGIGFLLNERHRKHKFQPISERLGILDVRWGRKTYRIFGVYVPDSSHPDIELEIMYAQLDENMRYARSKNHCCILAGDFNAQVGRTEDFDGHFRALGPYGFQDRSSRGNWLLEWCESHDLVLANTFFDTDVSNAWTYRNGTLYKQLDYIIVDRFVFARVLWSSVHTEMDIGSDHRPVMVKLRCSAPRAQACHKAKRKDSQWAVHVERYKSELDALLSQPRAVGAQDDCKQKRIQEIILQAEERSRVQTDRVKSVPGPEDDQMKRLIEERRALQLDETTRADERDSRRKEICKQIQKLTRKRARMRKTAAIQKILSEFRGLKEIAGIGQRTNKPCIASLQDCAGNLKSDAADIAEIFASFYECLYKSQRQAPEQTQYDSASTAEPVSLDELLDALRVMKRGRAKDEAGIVIEMLKDGSRCLLQAVVDMFNDVLAFRQQPPTEWKLTKLVVIFKKGDPSLPSNYRPIAILSILYKLFSRVLCSRLMEFLIPQQSVDQAAYRKGFSTQDHLLAVTLLIEKSREFNFPVWFALVDFEKAFDTVEHGILWQTLVQQGVPVHYVALLEKIYSEQMVSVQAGTRSRWFSISRGVRQGDPISALLFIAIMQACFGELQTKWGKANKRRKGLQFGVPVGLNGRNLTDLRFADDVIMVAQRRGDIAKMLRDLSACALKFGLKINYSKTRVLTWNALAGAGRSIRVGDESVSILDEMDSEKYLGRKLSFENCHDTELSNRIRAAWACFHKHKSVLCSKYYRLADRVRLFEATVSPTLLYGCATWALTAAMEHQLKVVWRRMLRYVFRIFRTQTNERELENWIDFVKRAASRVDVLAEQMGMEGWIATSRRRKWKFAGQLVRKTDDRWSKLLLTWRPYNGHGRGPGRPRTRWNDSIAEFCGGDWLSIAADECRWNDLEDLYALMARD